MNIKTYFSVVERDIIIDNDMGQVEEAVKAPIKSGVLSPTTVPTNTTNYEQQFQDTLQMMKDYTATMTKSVKKLDSDVRKSVNEQKDLNQQYAKSLELYSEHYLDCSKRNLEESGDYKKVLDQCIQVNERVSKTELKLNVVKEVAVSYTHLTLPTICSV